MNARRKFLAIGLALVGFGRRALALRRGSGQALRPGSGQAQPASAPVRYAPLTIPVTIPLESVVAPWRTVSFVAEALSPAAPDAQKRRRVLISGVLFSNGVDLSALCVTCPHEQCQVDLVTDEVRLNRMVPGAAHPFFECGCHLSVFDAAKYGARVSGESPRGLYRFQIAGIKGGLVEITEIEETALSEVDDRLNPKRHHNCCRPCVPRSLFPKARTAVLLVDVINLFDFPGGAAFARRALRPARHIQRLRARAHRAGVPVIYVNDNWGRWRSDFKTIVADCSRPGRPGAAIAQLLQPTSSDFFVLKPHLSGFTRRRSTRCCSPAACKTLVIAGLPPTTACCSPRLKPTCATTTSSCRPIAAPPSAIVSGATH